KLLKTYMPLHHTTICSISNQVATTVCMSAVTAYDIDLPMDKVPIAACQIHGCSQWPFAQQAPGIPQKAGTFPGRLFISFRRLFGGRRISFLSITVNLPEDRGEIIGRRCFNRTLRDFAASAGSVRSKHCFQPGNNPG